MGKKTKKIHISDKKVFKKVLIKVLSKYINKTKQYLRPYYYKFYFSGKSYKKNRNLGTVRIRFKIFLLPYNAINRKVVFNFILIKWKKNKTNYKYDTIVQENMGKLVAAIPAEDEREEVVHMTVDEMVQVLDTPDFDGDHQVEDGTRDGEGLGLGDWLALYRSQNAAELPVIDITGAKPSAGLRPAKAGHRGNHPKRGGKRGGYYKRSKN